jgi:hypothetical protein
MEGLPPDFLSSLLASRVFMRFPLRKTAYVVLASAVKLEIRVAHDFRPRYALANLGHPCGSVKPAAGLRGRPAVSHISKSRYGAPGFVCGDRALIREDAPIGPGGARAWPESQIRGPEPGRDPTSPPWQPDRRKAGSCSWGAYRGW